MLSWFSPLFKEKHLANFFLPTHKILLTFFYFIMIKHDKICDNLEKRLEQKNYVSQTHKCMEYSKGECDILTLQNNRFVYYEVKSNDSPKSLYKATKQLQRWSKYWHKHYKKDCYGVYYTPTKIMILTKNGKVR